MSGFAIRREGGASRPRCALLVGAVLALAVYSVSVLAQTSEVYWSDPATGLAIAGYDPVSYFADGRARRGREAYEFTWSDAVWRFVNEGNMEAFRRNPEVYAPQFGGHGAYAMSKRRANEADPEVWVVYRERLYLFFSETARDAWQPAAEDHIARAAKNWAWIAPRLAR